jgi:hypothetical protein
MAACWERFIGVLGEALAADPNYTAAWQDAVTASVQRMIGSLAASGGGADLDGFRAEYDELWRRGELQGPGVADLFSRYAAFLIDAGVDVDPDGVVDETLRAVFGPLLEDVEILDCDRPFSGLPVLLYNAAVTGDAAPGRRR